MRFSDHLTPRRRYRERAAHHCPRSLPRCCADDEALPAGRPFVKRGAGSLASLCREALERGVTAAFAFPLISGGVAIGALDLYARIRLDLDDEQVDDALLLADLVAVAVEHAGASNAIECAGISTESRAFGTSRSTKRSTCCGGLLANTAGVCPRSPKVSSTAQSRFRTRIEPVDAPTCLSGQARS